MRAGLVVPWDAAGIRTCADLGVTDARLGWESPPWDEKQLHGIVDTIHAAGLRLTLCVSPHSRQYSEQGFVAFAGRCANLLNPLLDQLEVMNEGNHIPFVNAPDPAAWARCFADVYTAVKIVRPKLPIILGGLAPESGPLDPRNFLVDAINRGPRIGGVSAVLLADGAALHAYSFPSDPLAPDPWNPVNYLDTLSDIFAYCGRPRMPFHLTEFGAPSGRTDIGDTGQPDPQYPNTPYRYDEAHQAEWLVRYLTAFRRSRANIQSAHWYTLDDGQAGAGSQWDPFTGLRNGTRWKPVSIPFRAWAAAAGRTT